MLPFATWREVFRIPWVRENSEGVRFLSDVFYLLLALYRTRRLRDFHRLQRVYFRMIDSFAQYGRGEAKDTVNRLLAIPWFAAHRRELYRLIAAYNHVVETLPPEEGAVPSPDRQATAGSHVEEFVRAFKDLTHFDEMDEARVQSLIDQPPVMEAMLEQILGMLE